LKMRLICGSARVHFKEPNLIRLLTAAPISGASFQKKICSLTS
jgi:hypothetical protein